MNNNTNTNINANTNTAANTNTNTNSSSDVDSYKQFSEYALVIYKFMIGLIDKYGIMTVDWMGYVLGLNKNGQPVSKQSAEELSENFKNLAEELKKPEVRESIILIIKEYFIILIYIIWELVYCQLQYIMGNYIFYSVKNLNLRILHLDFPTLEVVPIIMNLILINIYLIHLYIRNYYMHLILINY